MLMITAHVPGKCACCNIPYGEGARLGLEYGKFWSSIRWLSNRGSSRRVGPISG